MSSLTALFSAYQFARSILLFAPSLAGFVIRFLIGFALNLMVKISVKLAFVIDAIIKKVR